MNLELTKLSGRKQKPEQIINAVRWAKEIGLECNVDLIFGWPQQTLATMEEDLLSLIELDVPHLTHYELNIGGPTDFSLNRRHELPSPELVKEMYHHSRELLAKHGYEQRTPYDFQKIHDRQDFIYEECRQDYHYREVWGWGYAAISDFPSAEVGGGWTLMNWRKLHQYREAIDAGQMPIECAFQREAEDLRLSLIFRNMQSLSINRQDYHRRFGSDIVQDDKPLWQAFEHLGLLNIAENDIKLSTEGGYYVPLMQIMLAESRTETLVERHYQQLKRQAETSQDLTKNFQTAS
ncbi:MAG: hypothetical protein R2865_12070 [Deinococcales bacterium]